MKEIQFIGLMKNHINFLQVMKLLHATTRGALAVGLLLGLGLATPAAAVTYLGVDVRMETGEGTLLDTTVYIPETGCTVTDASEVVHEFETPNALCALVSAAEANDLSYELLDYGFGLFLNGVDEYVGDAENYWLYYVNLESAAVGMSEYDLSDGDELLLTYGGYEAPYRLTLSDVHVTEGQSVTATAESYTYDWETGVGEFTPMADTTVYFGDSEVVTDENGRAEFTPEEQGAYTVQVEAYRYTRSNPETLRVYIKMDGKFQTLGKFRRKEIRKAGVSYLKDSVDDDGLVDGDQSLTDWSVMALASAGKRDKKMFKAVKRHKPKTKEEGVSSVARHIMALAALGKNPRNYKKINYVRRLKNGFEDGQFGDAELCNDDVFSVLALVAADAKWSSFYLHDGVAATLECQNEDGGFGYSTGSSSDVDSTAAWLMMAYRVKGKDIGINISDERKAAMDYLKAAQNPDGGWGYNSDAISNSDSTAWALMALKARGHEAKSVTNNNLNGFHFLAETANGNGSFSYDTHGNDSLESLNTAYSVMALYGRPFPVNKRVKFKKRGK